MENWIDHLFALLGIGWVEEYRRPGLDMRIRNGELQKIPCEVIYERNQYTHQQRARKVF